MSNAPTVLLGEVPLIRAFVRSATTDTATTVTPDDSGSMFVNLSTTGNHTYTLSGGVAAFKGKWFIFFNAQTSYATIVTDGDSGDDIMCGDDTGADTVTGSAVTGDWMMITSDGTYFYGFKGYGTWTAS